MSRYVVCFLHINVSTVWPYIIHIYSYHIPKIFKYIYLPDENSFGLKYKKLSRRMAINSERKYMHMAARQVKHKSEFLGVLTHLIRLARLHHNIFICFRSRHKSNRSGIQIFYICAVPQTNYQIPVQDKSSLLCFFFVKQISIIKIKKLCWTYLKIG